MLSSVQSFGGERPQLVRPNATLQDTKSPVTVADSIRMTRLADPWYLLGASSEGRVAEFSPDGTQFTVVLRKGLLEQNANEYSLYLCQTANAFESPEPTLLLTFISSSNRPAISDVKWLDDNETLMFLGAQSGGLRQVYTLNTSSKKITKVTDFQTDVRSYETTKIGDPVVVETEPPVVKLLTTPAKRDGIIVGTSQLLADLVLLEDRSDTIAKSQVSVKCKGSAPVELDLVKGGLFSSSLSPDGKYLVTLTRTENIPDSWKPGAEPILRGLDGAPVWMPQYTLISTKTGAKQPLIDAPASPFGSEIVWSSDSRSVIVTNVHLPCSGYQGSRRQSEDSETYVVAIGIPGLELSKVAKGDLKLVKLEENTKTLIFEPRNSGGDGERLAYQKVKEAWKQVPLVNFDRTRTKQVRVELDEDLNTPPKIFVVDPDSKRKSLLLDLNPQFRQLNFGTVEAVTWQATDGHIVQGGLYRPPNYEPGKRYPAVIQTHGFNSSRFWIDGPWTTAFAAQALAAEGFLVLQVGSSPDGQDATYAITTQEAPRQMAAYEGGIDYLDRIGAIDRDRVGIIGFSMTCYHVKYALTHSKYKFAAAVVADGTDAGYFQYILLGVNDSQTVMEAEKVNGGPPFGDGLSSWIKRSVSFQIDKVQTPLRIQALSPFSVMGEWDWFAAMSLLKKPVEMIYLPEAEHILEKPWERMVSQQGDVDWFVFWLKGEEDPDPTKAEQYARWHELRRLQQQNSTKSQAGSAAMH